MKIVIIGAGGHGRVVLDILRRCGEMRIAGFIDADVSRAGTTLDGVPVLGPVNMLPKLRREDVRGAIVAVGDNRVRLSYAREAAEAGLRLISAVHPAAVVSPAASVGENVVVAAGAVVGAGASIADSAIINTSAVVDHECEIDRGAHICPGALLAGRVHVEEGAFVGLGAHILPCLKVGAWAVVGAGAVVLDDVPAGATVVGVPARIIRMETSRTPV